MEDDQREAIDAPDGEPMPALEVIIARPDGSQLKRYVFEPSQGYMYSEDNFQLSYQRMVSDYISELQIIENDKVVAEKNIEVNHPLKFGGYHFYQSSYDAEAGQYTVLEVVSDSGLNLVYAGYLMLCVGVFWQLWLRRLSFGISFCQRVSVTHIYRNKITKRIDGN
ncbi:Cytochrome c biogenesis protein Ccs1 [subsurface metagenome]